MRFLLPVVVSLLTLGFACGGGDEPEDEPSGDETEEKAEADEKTGDDKTDGDADADETPRGKIGNPGAGRGKAKRTGVPFADAKVVCCKHERVNRIMEEYLDVHQNLVTGTASTGDANALWGNLNAAAEDASLSRADRDAAKKAADETAKFRDADNATMQKHFSVVGEQLRVLVNNHKGGGDYTVAYTVCSLAGSSYWYQTSTAVQNPFGHTGPAKNCGYFEP